MEAEINYLTSCQSATNWAIEGDGSLSNSVTFESSFPSIAENVDDDNGNGLVPVVPKTLLLRPPSPNSSPCEITIRFSQKHEVQQVYVRSTARVYEIYYTTRLQKCNEYLCTVRCGIATRDGEVLRTTGVREASLAHPKEPVKDLAMISRNEGAVNTNEDDWVEVKPPLLDLRSSSVLYSFDGDHPGESVQDFYEATAEIADAEPCISITLRLLSLQNKGCLFLDEVYVFADPVDPADSENQAGQVENMAGSSVIAMLVPTLLQLSKQSDVRRIQDKQSSDMVENQKTKESGSKANKSTQVADKICQEGKSRMADDQLEDNIQEAVASTAKTPQLETPPEVSGAEIKPNLSCSHTDSLLGQLVSRVSKIEDLFLRFEEHMLKPISNIDERLQHVEQALEKLVEKFQDSGLPSCTRIIAPEFSCHESDHNSSYSNGNNNFNYGSSEVNEEDSLAVTLDDIDNTTNVGQSVPGLVVTAPEFVNIDDEDYSSLKNSPEDKEKHSVSIDDALASALSGFLASTLVERQRCIEPFAPKVDEFSNEEDNDGNKKGLSNINCGESTGLLSGSDALEGAECIKGSVYNSQCISFVEGEGNVMRSLDYVSEGPIDGIPEQCQRKVGAEDAFECAVADSKVSLPGHDLENTDSNQLREKNPGSGEPDIHNQCLGSRIDNSSNSTQSGVASSDFGTPRKEVKRCHNDVLQDVLKFSHGLCLDFEASILDVKFISVENSDGKSSVEALFNELPTSNVESPAFGENVDGFGHCNLISVGDEELTGPPTNTLFSTNIEYCNVDYIPLSLEGENPHGFCHYACNNQEMPATSLI